MTFADLELNCYFYRCRVNRDACIKTGANTYVNLDARIAYEVCERDFEVERSDLQLQHVSEKSL